jgi:hypothetical protein
MKLGGLLGNVLQNWRKLVIKQPYVSDFKSIFKSKIYGTLSSVPPNFI